MAIDLSGVDAWPTDGGREGGGASPRSASNALPLLCDRQRTGGSISDRNNHTLAFAALARRLHGGISRKRQAAIIDIILI